MAFEFITPDNLKTAFEDAKKFMGPIHDPFDEYERIARNKPWPNIAKGLPRVTDGTTAALIQDQGKRVVQQIPTGKVETEDEWLEVIAGFILEHEILPNSEEVAMLIQKCWAVISKALTYGSQPTFTQFVNRGDYYGTDFTLPYIKDVLLEPGKLSDKDSNVIFLRTWWTKTQLQAIIQKEDGLGKRAKERGDEYESKWDISQLQSLLDTGGSQKDAQQMSPQERGKQLNNGFFEIVHAFQKGVGSTFYSFAPKLAGDDNHGIVRKRTNPDPRGFIPIEFMYANIDFSNPLGRGIVEMVGGVQNLLDSEMQTYQYMRSLMMDPPLEIRGNVPDGIFSMEPGAHWRTGSNPDASIAPVKLETASLQAFPQNQQLMRSQILNLNNGGGDTSISAEDAGGVGGSSKTPAGVKATMSKLGMGDNYIRKQFEAWFGNTCETMLNLWFAERSGIQVLTLNEETAAKIRKLKPEAVNEKNQVRIDYDEETPKLKFKVDASSSSQEDNATQLEALDGLLERYEKSPILQQIIPPDKIAGMWNKVVSVSGVEDAEKLTLEMDAEGKIKKDENEQPQQPDMTPEMVQQMIEQAIQEEKAQKPEVNPTLELMKAAGIKFTDLDPTAQQKLLEMVQLPSDGQTASVVDQQFKEQELALQAQQATHQQQMDGMTTALKGHELQLKIAQQHQSQRQGEADNQLKGAQFGHTVDQAKVQNKLAEKAASQKPAAPAKTGVK